MRLALNLFEKIFAIVGARGRIEMFRNEAVAVRDGDVDLPAGAGGAVDRSSLKAEAGFAR
ncbi:hypothetical protein PWG15_05940 [Ensifer adhaerens]|uniref:hypothetical protein n=1 Tax=Ensifer adhaerens TaxID=106592 RepID=UPI0023A985F0|nr:hypothetical protein [Ensifer adhaerens]WDZ78041.1 hypothetical protein PWG15_05940 [Ensifer adhaerens]